MSERKKDMTVRNTYIIRKNINETDESYEKREWFIKQNKPKNEKELEKFLILSNVWVNILYLNCIYPIEIMKRIQTILNSQGHKNFFSKET